MTLGRGNLRGWDCVAQQEAGGSQLGMSSAAGERSRFMATDEN
mgnify:CR=1 FL=1